mmetsp:Transcript_60472/g.184754  ORF Transcript_60472/g.184754 Transcript_60472/m.184754 type:complete len:252 (-) Transcript_60472:582-1337(-)
MVARVGFLVMHSPSPRWSSNHACQLSQPLCFIHRISLYTSSAGPMMKPEFTKRRSSFGGSRFFSKAAHAFDFKPNALNMASFLVRSRNSASWRPGVGGFCQGSPPTTTGAPPARVILWYLVRSSSSEQPPKPTSESMRMINFLRCDGTYCAKSLSNCTIFAQKPRCHCAPDPTLRKNLPGTPGTVKKPVGRRVSTVKMSMDACRCGCRAGVPLARLQHQHEPQVPFPRVMRYSMPPSVPTLSHHLSSWSST